MAGPACPVLETMARLEARRSGNRSSAYQTMATRWRDCDENHERWDRYWGHVKGERPIEAWIEVDALLDEPPALWRYSYLGGAMTPMGGDARSLERKILERLEEIVAEYPADPWCTCYAAMLFARAGDDARANELALRVQQLDPVWRPLALERGRAHRAWFDIHQFTGEIARGDPEGFRLAYEQ